MFTEGRVGNDNKTVAFESRNKILAKLTEYISMLIVYISSVL